MSMNLHLHLQALGGGAFTKRYHGSYNKIQKYTQKAESERIVHDENK